MKQQHRLWIIGVVAILLVAVVAFAQGNPAGPEKTLALQAPVFLNSVSSTSTGAPPEVVAMLNSEAGISAYIQTANPIVLNEARGAYRTIEAETEDYIIGSVLIPDHPEHFDVHVYVHKDGWILAYYMNNEAISKMVDVKAKTISTTKLETAISITAGFAGQAVTGLKYYDFRYPNATNILMVAENGVDGNNFTIQIPPDFGYSERSWALYHTAGYNNPSYFKIDGSNAPVDWSGSSMHYGAIPASSLLPGEPYVITIPGTSDAYGVLVITYRVP